MWWIVFSIGLLLMLVGYASTTRWGLATAERAAEIIERETDADAPDPPVESSVDPSADASGAASERQPAGVD